MGAENKMVGLMRCAHLIGSIITPHFFHLIPEYDADRRKYQRADDTKHNDAPHIVPIYKIRDQWQMHHVHGLDASSAQATHIVDHENANKMHQDWYRHQHH